MVIPLLEPKNKVIQFLQGFEIISVKSGGVKSPVKFRFEKIQAGFLYYFFPLSC
jgi:hypothetical protein